MKKEKFKKMCQMCLCMIVKNEAHIILETLNSVLPYIQYWVICDTGSTDGTQDIIKKFFAEKNIPGELHQHEWKNFGWNRSRAFECAYKKSKYVFVIDADDIIVGDMILPKNMNADAYFLKFGNGHTYVRLQIFDNQLQWIYRGVLHEFAICKQKNRNKFETLEGDFYIESRRLGARNQDPLKYQKDAQVLVKAIEDKVDPDLFARYLFYAAQSFRDAKDFENSIIYYKKRVDEGGWNEEVFYSCLQIGIMKMILINQEAKKNNAKPDYKSCIDIFLYGYNKCQYRSETLFEIGRIYYNNKEYQKAYSYFLMVTKIKCPKNSLFLNETIYKIHGFIEFAKTCNKLKKFEESNATLNNLLASKVMLELMDSKMINYLLDKNNKNIVMEGTEKVDVSGYTFIPNKDCFGNDLFAKDIESFDFNIYKQIADDLPMCKGFNTRGYFKKELCHINKMIPLENKQDLVLDGIYIKNNYLREIYDEQNESKDRYESNERVGAIESDIDTDVLF